MESEELVSSEDICWHLVGLGFTEGEDEGRLMLLELLCKAGAGYYNSHTEEAFLRRFPLMTRRRTPNKRGRLFIASMLYSHSNTRPMCFELMQKYRR